MPTWETLVSGLLRLARLDSIRRRVLVFALLATLAPASIIGWQSYVLHSRAAEQAVSDALRGATIQAARESSLWFKGRLHELRVFSSSYEVSENLERALTGAGPATVLAASRRRLTDYLKSVEARFPDYAQLAVLATDGEVVATSGAGPLAPLPAEWRERVRTGSPVAGHVGPGSSGAAARAVVAVPVVSGARREVGFFVGVLDLTAIQALLETLAPGRTGRLALVAENGTVLVSSRSSSSERPVPPPSAPLVRKLFGNEGSPDTYVDPDGRITAGVLGRVPGVEWGVVTEMGLDDAYDEIRRIRNRTLGMVAALVLGVGLVAYVLALSIVGPLDRLTEAARAVATGNLEVDLPVLDPGEVGQMTRAFNHMVARLREGRAALAASNAALSEKNRALEALSVTDALTGLHNRKHLADALGSEIARARRLRHPLGLLMLDIDHFKDYNDTHGHLAGDEVLQRVAALFRVAIRNIDYAARYGGEEFVILLPGTDSAAAMEVAERVRAGVADARFGPEGRRVTISVGVAAFPEHGREPDALIARADAALYEAKRAGRDRVVLAPAGRRPESEA